MYPAPSVIIFTVLSGLGFGYLGLLGLGVVRPGSWAGFWLWGLGYGLAVGGLLASAAHLGNPRRALLAFTQWRSSWLSREAWASVAALLTLAPLALSDIFGWGLPRGFGGIGALLCLGTVVSTAMIYAQIRAVPRWHNATVPAVFVGFAVAGGALLAGQRGAATALLALLGLAMLAHWRVGDTAFARAGSTLGTATGLGATGHVSVFEQPHTGGNYLLCEMIHVVARRHVPRLRAIAIGAGVVMPVLCLWLLPGLWGIGLGTLIHLVGTFAQRWLFFAEAEHVVGLYYGERGP